MGANVGKSQNSVSYSMPRRRRTVPNDTGNHFSKDYWETADGGVQRSTMRPEYWMIGSEKKYRDQVFKNKPENVYSKSNALYRRTPGSFDSPFSPSTSNGRAGAGSMADRSAPNSVGGSSSVGVHPALKSIISLSGQSSSNQRGGCGNATPAAPRHQPLSSCYSSPHRTVPGYNSGHSYGSSYNTYSKYVPPCKF